MSIDPRRLCQIEIPVTDVDRALVFYREAFGWERSPAEIHDYLVLQVPDDCPFGIALVPQPAPVHQTAATPQTAAQRTGPTVYFAVADAESLVAQVEVAGGRRRFGPMRLPGYGSVWQVEDPDGNRLGLAQAEAERPA